MKMKNRVNKTIILFVIISFLSSCATIPGMSLDFKTPQNSEERKILVQAVAVGAAGGAAAGWLLSRIKKLQKYTPWMISGGAVLGSAVAYTIANSQIATLRNLQLENDRLATLLNNARQYNREVESYNNELKKEIVHLELNTTPEKRRLAQQKKQQAKQYQKQVEKMIQERTTLSNTLVPAQKAQYQRTLEELKRKDKKLLATIKELERISGPVRVGSRSGSMKILI